MILKRLLRWEKFQKARPVKYYEDLSIPAKLFFDIIETGEVEKLVISGTPTENGLENAWDSIFDKYFAAREDGKLKLMMRTRGRIALLSQKLAVMQAVVRFMATYPLTKEERLEVVDKLAEIGVKINKEAPIVDEIMKVLKNSIPALETRLRLEKHNLDELAKGKKISYEKALVSMETCFGYSLSPDITLAKYLAYEEKAIQISNDRKKQAIKNKRKRK